MPLTVSVAARLQRDAQLICNVLEKAGMRTHTMTVEGPESLVHATEGGCLVLAEELLDAEIIGWLRDVLLSEPPWSDFPVILLTLAGEVSLTTQKRREFRGPLGNLVLLERPIRPETLISTVQNALRARAAIPDPRPDRTIQAGRTGPAPVGKARRGRQTRLQHRT